MQLFRLAEAPISDRDFVVAYSPRRAVVFLILYLIGALVIVLLSHAKASVAGYYFAGVMLLFLLIFQKTITARFRPSNWLLRLSDHGLFIKFRSYLNCHFAVDDHTVVFVSYSEIRSAKRVDETQEVPDRDENRRPTTTIRKVRWLEIELAADTRQLAIAMANETDTVLARTRIGDEKPSTRYRHFPVTLPNPTTLRIEWAVVPKIEVVLERLTRHTLVRPAETSARKFTDLDKLSRAEQETQLLELAETGDKIAAIDLARRLYGYDLTQAANFVEGLARKMP